MLSVTLLMLAYTHTHSHTNGTNDGGPSQSSSLYSHPLYWVCIDFITNGKRNTSTFACTGEALIPLPQRQSPRTLSVSRKHSATCILEQWLSCLTGAEAKVKTPFDSEFVFRLHPHSLRKETRSGRRSCQEKRLLLM